MYAACIIVSVDENEILNVKEDLDKIGRVHYASSLKQNPATHKSKYRYIIIS